MKAIAANFRYISKNGRLDIEDEQGQISHGREVVRELAEDWRYGGTLIDDISHRREAFNIILSMPRGTDPLSVLRSAREFAPTELADHKYVLVLHDHQANPHVHISVRAESKHGRRLNPRKAICSAGERPSRRSCAAGASMPRRAGKPLVGSIATTRACGARRPRRRAGSATLAQGGRSVRTR
jgi:hypothetical protein